MIDKIRYTEEEINQIDEFLKKVHPVKGYFDWQEFYKNNYTDGKTHYDVYHPDDEKLYYLLNHKAFVVVMITPVGKNEKYAVTEKGHEVYDVGGFANWLNYNKARIEYIKNKPIREIRTYRINFFSAVAMILLTFGLFYYSCQEFRLNEKTSKEMTRNKPSHIKQINIIESNSVGLDRSSGDSLNNGKVIEKVDSLSKTD